LSSAAVEKLVYPLNNLYSAAATIFWAADSDRDPRSLASQCQGS